MNYSQALVPEGGGQWSNAGEASGPPPGASKAGCSLLGVQDDREPVSTPHPSHGAPLGVSRRVWALL